MAGKSHASRTGRTDRRRAQQWGSTRSVSSSRRLAEKSSNQVAVDTITGHEQGDMASHYRERISDGRLRRVIDTIHAWLFGPPDDDPDDRADAPDVDHEDGQPATVPFRVFG